MIADRFLSHLEGVRSTGQDRWLARCPAHDDKNPSLAIREVDDRVLIHCFAGCDVSEVVSAVGLELSDLFPPKVPIEGHKPISRPFPAADILRALGSDITFITICAGDVAKGEQLEPKDMQYLFNAAARFRAALQAGGINHAS